MNDKATNRPSVGVGVIVQDGSKVLLGLRCSAHGANTWCFPGGHLEFGETPLECAQRELLEETGLSVKELKLGPYTNDVFEADKKHYVTLFVIAKYNGGTAQLLEPEKCKEWRWFDWSNLPTPLFLAVQSLIKQGFTLENECALQ